MAGVRRTNHRVGELVYGRVTKLVPFGAFVQVGDGIEGLVHISEMSAHHVDLPEQVVTPGEELWVKIIDLDLQRRRISLSIKQAAEGGVVAAEYQEHFGEHAYDEEGNYIGADHRRRARAGLARVPRRHREPGAGTPAELAEAPEAPEADVAGVPEAAAEADVAGETPEVSPEPPATEGDDTASGLTATADKRSNFSVLPAPVRDPRTAPAAIVSARKIADLGHFGGRGDEISRHFS